MATQSKIKIDQNWLDSNKNENLSIFDQVINYCEELNGARRILRLFRSASRFYNEIAPSSIAKNFEKTASTSLACLGIIALPFSTIKLCKGAAKIIRPAPSGKESSGLTVKRKVELAVREAARAFTSWCQAFIFFSLAGPGLKDVTQPAILSAEVVDLSMSFGDFLEARSFEEAATGDVKEVFAHTRNYFMVRTAKAVIAVVAAIFTIFMFATGIKLIPVVITAFLSLVTASLAICADLLKKRGKYKVIEFKKSVSI